jgi:hypothetical protein
LGKKWLSAHRSGWIEPVRIVLGDHRHRVGCGVVIPDLADVRIVADVLQNDHVALLVDREAGLRVKSWKLYFDAHPRKRKKKNRSLLSGKGAV